MALIDRDALIEYMMPYLHNEDELQPADVIADIRVQPVIDAKPVVHGEWSSLPFNLWQCTRCAKIFEYAYNFCPHCGADMRGGNHDQE